MTIWGFSDIIIFMKNRNKTKGHKKWIFYLILGGLFIKLLSFLFKKGRINDISDNLKDFARQEKKEVAELAHGQQSWKKFCYDFGSVFKDYFVPHDGNDNKPKLLRAKSLAAIVIVLLLLKITVTGYLFFIYPDQAEMAAKMTTEILKLTNQDRIANNLVPLSLNSVLSASALAKAENMVINNYFAHHSPDGKKPWDWISRDKYAYLLVGENLAMNFTSAQSAHQALMQSPSHQNNILNAKYNDIGLAVISGEMNGKRTNILVELFSYEKPPQPVLAAKPDQTAGNTEEKLAKAEDEKTEVLATQNIKAEEQPAIAPKTESLPKPAPQQKPETKEDLPESKTEPVKPRIIMLEDFTPLARGEPTTIALGEEETTISPNLALERNPNTKVSFYAVTTDKKIGLANKLIAWSKYIYLGALLLMIMALIVNIVIRITIQHKPVIIQTIVAIFFIGGLISLRLHILEHILENVAIV